MFSNSNVPKGNYDQMPSSDERRRIAESDRKHPSMIGAGRILISKKHRSLSLPPRPRKAALPATASP
jgi:hypothetical protein